jgi:hypothetical protein
MPVGLANEQRGLLLTVEKHAHRPAALAGETFFFEVGRGDTIQSISTRTVASHPAASMALAKAATMRP